MCPVRGIECSQVNISSAFEDPGCGAELLHVGAADVPQKPCTSLGGTLSLRGQQPENRNYTD